MKILAFAASSSTRSINKKLVTYAVSLLPSSVDKEVIDLNDYELPLFSQDREDELGHPQLAQDFLDKIAAANGIVISFAEHNGYYSAAYKNLFDWCSRINPKVFQNKPVVFLSTSPGPRGGKGVLELACKSSSHFGADLKANLAVGSFYEHFDINKNCLITAKLQQELEETVNCLIS